MAALYLIPVTLGDTPHDRVLPAANADIVRSIRHFVVEEIRTARRFLKAVDRNIDIDALTFYEMGKHADRSRFSSFLRPLREGQDVGVISEAGCPAVADPGADLVAIAQQEGLRVVPLVGPSSILLAVMASGFNGQSFAFHGYLPIDGSARTNASNSWKPVRATNTKRNSSSRRPTATPNSLPTSFRPVRPKRDSVSRRHHHRPRVDLHTQRQNVETNGLARFG